MSGYLGSIGFGYPAAIGAWAAAPGRPIVAVTGDGGFGQYAAELTTAVKYGIPIKHVLLDNHALGKISKEQLAADYPVWQTSLHNPDWAAYAELCGATGIRVTRRDRARRRDDRSCSPPTGPPCSASSRTPNCSDPALDHTERRDHDRDAPRPGYDDLRALFINCTLKTSPEPSHTEGLVDVSRHIMEKHGVAGRRGPRDRPRHRHRRLAGHDRARLGRPTTGRRSSRRCMAADILVLAGPIWLGDNSSVTKQVHRAAVRRLAPAQRRRASTLYYGRVGGCLITGNEDGVKHCAQNVLYRLQHIGYTIPPQADAGWIGEAGPGPSYLDPGSGGPENDFTNRNTTFMTWNLMHLARMLKDAGGIPAYGNQRSEWDAGCRFDFENPEYR